MKTLNFRLRSFVSELKKKYGYTINKSYRSIATDIEGLSHVTVKTYLYQLEQLGYIRIENKGTHRQMYIFTDKFQNYED
ncbi:helix-turn-helix transcriptional regulator [Bacteroides sp. 214]|uniref:helix-turn-helix transcriptional regulator n=1 Tax=Bacteroides sp. 214 TaxID=2302935 RepID=UPI0013D88703|nr:helix-turn-helix transcriptional regulator [Bacteroides sp. 214]